MFPWQWHWRYNWCDISLEWLILATLMIYFSNFNILNRGLLFSISAYWLVDVGDVNLQDWWLFSFSLLQRAIQRFLEKKMVFQRMLACVSLFSKVLWSFSKRVSSFGICFGLNFVSVWFFFFLCAFVWFKYTLEKSILINFH